MELVFDRYKEDVEDLIGKTTLVEDKDREIKTDENKPTNLLIEGDNLLSLNHLLKTHKSLINVIYIDPPYRTQNKKFKYNDYFKTHDEWLSFMEKRLVLAKELMSDDGVIFISIDDNEFAQLKLLCDDIFKEENFISNIIWKSNPNGRGDDKYIGRTCEYILTYRKSNMCKFKYEQQNLEQFNLEDDKGIYCEQILYSSLTYSPSLDYIIYAPDGSEIYAGGSYEKWKERQLGKNSGKDFCWRWSEKKLKDEISNNNVVFKKDRNNNWKVYRKRRPVESENGSAPFKNLYDDAGTRHGTKLLKELFQDKNVFDHPKPIQLIKFLLSLHPNKDSTVLDFFAGSGTTGHAIMELNEEDNGNRQYILCTNNEVNERNQNEIQKELKARGLEEDSPKWKKEKQKRMDEEGICRKVTYPRLEKVINGYTNSKGKEVEGLGGNLKYYKIE